MKEGHTHSTHACPTHFTHAQYTLRDNKSVMLLGLLRDHEGREERESLEFGSEVSSVCCIGWELVLKRGVL